MDYQTLQTVINDLDAIQSLEGVYRLIEKYEAMAEAVEADMAREFGQDIDWENEEVKDLFELKWTTAHKNNRSHGGIGIHNRLKICRRKAFRFESGCEHQGVLSSIG